VWERDPTATAPSVEGRSPRYLWVRAIIESVAPIELETRVAPDPGTAGREGLRALADELLTTMASIRRSARLLARRPLELSTLTGSQVDLVRLLRRRAGISVAQAAEELRLAPNTVSTLVRQLSDAGLVRRSPDSHDRRVVRLELAAEMQAKVDAFRDRRVAALSAAMASLDPSERARLAEAIALLRRLATRPPLQEESGE
jgi:DNA-binding MarR family transcriptional regulator